jgi:hypothetical protein
MRSVLFVVIAALMFATVSRITHSPVEGLSFATAKKPVIFIGVPSAGLLPADWNFAARV